MENVLCAVLAVHGGAKLLCKLEKGSENYLFHLLARS